MLGSVFSECQWAQPGANIPMYRWMKGLVDGMAAANGAKPILIGHSYEASWPKGRLFPPRIGENDSAVNLSLVRFSNLPFIRSLELSLHYASSFKEVIRSYDKDTVLVTYNPYPWHLAVGERFKRNGGKWINMVLDMDERRLGEGWKGFRQLCGNADGHVFVSWWAYQNCPIGPKLHLDAGVNAVRPWEETRISLRGPKVVMYVGKITLDGGADLLAEAFLMLPGDDVEFWVCGRGETKKLNDAAKRDARIRIFGQVDEEKLTELAERASIFVNPRSPDSPLNRMIFPSKLMYYLSFGKPVVSTWTDGLAPEYREVLTIPKSVGSKSFAETIRTVFDSPEEQRRDLHERIVRFVEKDRNWKNQAGRLNGFIEKILSA